MPRWLWSVYAYQRALRRREASLLRRATVVRRASCGLQRQASAACRAAHARRRSLSLGRRRSTRACCARAPCRAGCDRLVLIEEHCTGERPLSFGARPWCDVPAAASNAKPAPRVSRAGALRSLSLGGGAALELAARARRAALVVVGLCPTEGHCAGERPLSFGARPWCDVPAAASNAKPAPRGSRGAGAPALAVSGEEAQHSSLLRARAVPRWLWSVVPRKSTAPARGLSPSARARGATCQLRPPTPSQRRVSRGAGAPALAVSGRRRSTRACCARAPCRAGCGRLCPIKGHCAGERPLSFGARPWCDVPAAASNAKPAPRVTRSAARRRSLSLGGGAALELAARARRAALVVVGSCPMKGTAPARGLSPSARARGATCQLRPPTPSQRRVSRGAGALRSLSLGRRRSTRACCARAVPRWLWSAYAHRKGTAPARGLSPSARARGATCQLRPPTPSQRRVSRGAGAPALAVSGRRRSTRACCVRAVPRWLWSALRLRKALRRREASLLRRATVVRRASCGLQRQASAACHAAQRACARCLWEEAQHSSLLRARAVPRWLWSAMP